MKTHAQQTTRLHWTKAAAVAVLIAISGVGHAQQINEPISVPLAFTRYKGVEIGLVSRNLRIKSNIAELKALPVSQLGTQVGMNWGNQMGKIRATVAMFYSNGNCARTIDMGEAAVAGNLYLLKGHMDKVHRIAPYAMARVSYQRSKFFGTYLGDNALTNYSVSKEPLLGSVDNVRATLGAGAEWRVVHTTEQFIHVFSEVSSGFAIRTRATEGFQGTTLSGPVRVTVGISCGLSMF